MATIGPITSFYVLTSSRSPTLLFLDHGLYFRAFVFYYNLFLSRVSLSFSAAGGASIGDTHYLRSVGYDLSHFGFLVTSTGPTRKQQLAAYQTTPSLFAIYSVCQWFWTIIVLQAILELSFSSTPTEFPLFLTT